MNETGIGWGVIKNNKRLKRTNGVWKQYLVKKAGPDVVAVQNQQHVYSGARL